MNEPDSRRASRNRHTLTPRLLYQGIAGLIVLWLVFAVVNHGVSTAQRTAQRTGQFQYDGITLFKGLFFASGPVPSRIPTLGRVAPYFPSEYKNLESQVIRSIQGKDPTFFDRFAGDIQSGDRVRISAAIKEGNKLHRQTLLEITKGSRTPFASQVRGLAALRESDPEPSPEPAKDVGVIVCLYVPIVVSAVTVKLPPNLQKGLSFERYVDEIARGLARN